jgi:hypothetical protein
MASINASTSGAGGLISTADATGNLSLQTAGTTALTVDASQNVGIGTTSPAAKLNVVGSFGDLNRALLVTPSSESAAIDALRTVAIQRVSNDTQLAIGYATTPDAWVISSSYGSTGAYKPLAFATSDTERMRITAAGDLLVGATSPTVGANNGTVIYGGADAGIIYMFRASGTDDQFRFYVNNTNVGRINTTPSATSYITSSDYRLKENIVPMTGALDKVALLKPVIYKWKVDGSDGQGFIAHELAEVVPDCVSGEKDAVDEDGNIKPQGIDTSFLVATLTAAIQEQQTIINDLKARIETLENK